MPTFRCKFATPAGSVVEKTLIADNKASLKNFLEEEGNFVLKIHSTERILTFFDWRGRRKSFRLRDFLSFNQEFAVLIKAGLPILSALDTVLERGANSDLYDLLREVRNDVSTGESLSAAFGKFSSVVSNLYVASLQAGEKSGSIALAISRYIAYIKKILAIRQKVITASIYPAILTTVSIFVLVFLMVFVVPTFTAAYFDSGTQLPGITLVLVAVSHSLKNNIYWVVLLAAGLWAGVIYAKRTATGRRLIDRAKLRMPLLGDIYLTYYVSRLARTLSTVLASGMPLVDAVRIASGTMDNFFLKETIQKVVKLLEEGGGFAASLDRVEVFPKMAIRMVDAGESGGALETVLDDVADFYEMDVDAKLTILTSAIEPALMVIMGLLIGFIVLAMYLPIFQLAGAI
jgi:type IV pilus assembly protein PilC